VSTTRSGVRQAIEATVVAIENDERLDGAATKLVAVIEQAFPTGPFRDGLHGVWLGHPLHPMLTDLPIGAWTSASVLDLLGGRSGRRAAQMLVGFGCLSAIPTALSGAADWSRVGKADRRVGLVHAGTNSAALVLYALAGKLRRAGRHLLGVALGLAGATAATAGGFLGGHLAYRRALGANRAADVTPPAAWTDVCESTDSADGQGPGVVLLEGEEIVVADDLGSGIAGRCTHEGGPLAEGKRVTISGERCVVCPWHGSTFGLRDGDVVHGPATSPEPAYDVRHDAGGWQVRVRRSHAAPSGAGTDDSAGTSNPTGKRSGGTQWRLANR
jgi:nitrite reductase/ring-hydroxylating ferredoxin subunit/uncharacterized membrane protein